MLRMLKSIPRPMAQQFASRKFDMHHSFRYFSSVNQQRLNQDLKHAITKDNEPMVSSLLSRNANPNEISIEKSTGSHNNEKTIMETPLHYILSKLEKFKCINVPELQNKFVKMFHSILEKTNVDTLNKTSESNTVMHRAASIGDSNIILALLAKGPDVRILNRLDETASDTYVKFLEYRDEIPDPKVIKAFTDAMEKPTSDLLHKNS